MTELTPRARRLLGLARRGDDPLASDRSRNDAKMARRFAAAAGVAAVGLGAAKSATGAVGITTLFGKGLVTGVVVAVATASVWHTARQYGQASTTAVANSAPTNHVTTNVPPSSRARSNETPSVTASVTTSTVEAIPARPVLPRVTAPSSSAFVRHASGSEPNVAPPISPPIDPLQAEVAALREAQRAIAAGSPARTLVLIEEQDTRFKGGALVEERSAARIFALCALHRTAEARKLGLAFEQRWPKSPLLSRVRRACDPSPTLAEGVE